MTCTPKVVMKQPHIEQLHDEVDCLVTKLGKVKQRAERLGDDTLLELVSDVQADADHLKGMLPARQLKLDF